MGRQVISLKQRYDLFEKQNSIGASAWPEFMLHDPVAMTYWTQLIEAFTEYQLMIIDGEEILAVINSVPLRFDKHINDLPDEGVEWGVKKSVSDFKAGLRPNFLMGVQIVVNKSHQGKGLSTKSMVEMCNLAIKRGIDKVIVPLRPSNKHMYPLIPMDEYIKWRNKDNLPFDNWLRVHLKMGGEIIKVCSKSMYIPGTVEEWEMWTRLEFPGSGSYIVPGALNPIRIDREKGKGSYIEPNVWLLHNLNT